MHSLRIIKLVFFVYDSLFWNKEFSILIRNEITISIVYIQDMVGASSLCKLLMRVSVLTLTVKLSWYICGILNVRPLQRIFNLFAHCLKAFGTYNHQCLPSISTSLKRKFLIKSTYFFSVIISLKAPKSLKNNTKCFHV